MASPHSGALPDPPALFPGPDPGEGGRTGQSITPGAVTWGFHRTPQVTSTAPVHQSRVLVQYQYTRTIPAQHQHAGAKNPVQYRRADGTARQYQCPSTGPQLSTSMPVRCTQCRTSTGPVTPVQDQYRTSTPVQDQYGALGLHWWWVVLCPCPCPPTRGRRVPPSHLRWGGGGGMDGR